MLAIAFLQNYIKEFISAIVPVTIWGINRAFKERDQLVQSTRHAFTFLIQEPLKDSQGVIVSQTQTVYTASVSISNSGRNSAKHVEIILNWEPPFLNIWPSRYYDKKIMEDNRCVLIFENLAPKDFIGFEMMSINRHLPLIIGARSEQSIAHIVQMVPQVVQPRWKSMTLIWLSVTGLALNIYAIALLIQIIAGSSAAR